MELAKRVEIITNSREFPKIIDILDTIQVTGYTILKSTAGKGDRGTVDEDLGRAFSNTYILIICTNNEQLNTLVDRVTPILKKVGGICLVTDASWIHY